MKRYRLAKIYKNNLPDVENPIESIKEHLTKLVQVTFLKDVTIRSYELFDYPNDTRDKHTKIWFEVRRLDGKPWKKEQIETLRIMEKSIEVGKKIFE